jgi:hypothetical protein
MQVMAATGFLAKLPFKPPILKFCSERNGYLTGWTLRAYLLDIMGMGGHKLTVDSQVSMTSFMTMNPDRKSHLIRLQKMLLQSEGWPTVTPNTFCKALGVQQKPELLSFFACFAGDVGFQDSDFEDFDTQVKKWWKFAEQFFDQHGLEPHPAIVAQGVRKNSDF